MSDLIQEQHEAFQAACKLVSHDRAEELLRLKRWENGGCLSGLLRPEVEPLSEEEKAAFKSLWMTLSPTYPWMEALYLVRNHHPAKTG